MSMPNRISTVATASLASALILLLPGARGSAAPKKTGEECEIDYKVCLKGCNGPAGDLGERCRAACDLTLVKCHQQAPKKAKPNNEAKPKKGIDGTPSGTWVPNSLKKGINGTPSGQWVPNSPAKGKGVPSVPAGGTWNPSPSSGAKGPTLRSSGGRR
jgi:uncharacterized membrane protein